MKYWNYIPKLGIYLSIILVAFSLITSTVGSEFSADDEQAHAAEHSEHAEDATEHGSEENDKGSHGLAGDLMTLGFLILLQAVLGFDNLLYISLESKHAPPEKQKSVRAWGIGLAIGLRIVLLFALYFAIETFEKLSVFQLSAPSPIQGNFNLHSLIVLAGGVFIIYTAMKEIWHMTRLEHDHHGHGEVKQKSAASAIFWIMVMLSLIHI